MKSLRYPVAYFAIAILFSFVVNFTYASNFIGRASSLQYNLNSNWVDSVFNTLTPDEKIAQLIMMPAWSNRDHKHVAEVSKLIRKFNIGGVIFFQGGPMRQAQQTNYYQWCAKTPLMIGIDGEWGLAMRLDSIQSFPRQMTLGAVQDNELIYEMGCEIAKQMKALGITINFAPVIDINNNPLNPVISNRSFGENKMMVAEKGAAYMMGMQDNGLLTTAKHFPGHGDTHDDSHFTLPVLNFGTDRLDSLELYPFRELISKNVAGMMVAHLNIPALDSAKNTPSTLSYNIITNLLKKKLGFTGLVFTDALNMRGAAGFSVKPGEIEVRALMAGNDVLLMPENVERAIIAIKSAIAEGRLRQSQIDSSCRKVLAAKEWAGLTKTKYVDMGALKEKLNSTSAKVILRKFAASSLTLLKNQDHIIPLKHLDTLRMATVLVGIDSAANQFKETLSLYTNFDVYNLPKTADSVYVDSLLFSLRHYNLVVVGIHNTDSRPSQNFGIAPNVVPFVERLVNIKPVIFSFFGSAYALNLFRDLHKCKAVLLSYQDFPSIQDYSAQLLFGGIGAKGKLPVTTNIFEVSSGLTTPEGVRLRYSLPEEIGIDSEKLLKIDTIVVDAIRKGAMPGCQVLAAKNGVIFYQKSFGNHTYEGNIPVKNSDIYDIASITKIAGMLPAVMKLYEKKDIKLNEKISHYLHDLKKSNKKDIILLDLLTHQAQLQSFIPFYLRTLRPLDPEVKLISSVSSVTNPIKLGPGSFGSRDVTYRDGLYSNHPDLEHGLEVAENLFLSNTYLDSIYKISKDSKLLPVKKYEYSDMDFYYLYWAVNRITKKPLNEFAETNFYSKLGATTLGYLPLSRFSKERIIPTENDIFFRKQLIQGYVHDPGAAMMGGVAGHAGLFSNANDLAKLMQMYLNKGTYGGETFFKASTIDYFTSCPFCSSHNRRGIGFDKPEMESKIGPTCQCVSAKSFGHTGFTGCLTWADPETGILYVFLSNRVYPDASNTKLAQMDVRTRIQEVLAKETQPITNK